MKLQNIINILKQHDYRYEVHQTHVNVRIDMSQNGKLAGYTITPVHNVGEVMALLGY